MYSRYYAIEPIERHFFGNIANMSKNEDNILGYDFMFVQYLYLTMVSGHITDANLNLGILPETPRRISQDIIRKASKDE